MNALTVGHYRKAGDSVKVFTTQHHPALALCDAAREAIDQATAETDLPMMMGKPEI